MSVKKINYKEFYDLVVPRLFEVAAYQTLMCGKLDNIGKEAQSDVTQNEIHGSLTYLDQFTQDYILVPVYQRWPDLVPLVEEDTGLKRSNINNVSDYSLIMDPIDGTAFYLRGDSDYSIMLGLMYKGEVEVGIICYPEDELIIASIKGQDAWTIKKDGARNELPKIKSVNFNQNSIACHYRFMREPYEIFASKLREAGNKLTSNDDGFGTNATGILRIAKGENCAFIAPHISLHDFAAPAFIIQELGGVIRLFEYRGLNDTDSWSKVLVNYGRPNAKGANPRYRVIIANSDETIDQILDTLTVSLDI